MVWTATVCLIVTSAMTAVASAHPVEVGVTPGNLWRSWTFEPAVVVLLTSAAIIYGVGIARLRRAPGGGAAVRARETAAFAGGWLVTALALASPLDAAGGVLFSAHMVQHEMLMIVAAPLLVVGTPLTVFVWATSGVWRRAPVLMRTAARLLNVASAAPVAWVLHAAAIIAWHVPALFDAAVHHAPVHAAQHASFFGTAWLFWWGLLRGGSRRAAYGVAVLSVFTTAVYTSVIGALLAVAPTQWYSAYSASTWSWGLSPVDDQQLGGLIMWVPGGLVYTAVGLWMFSEWLRDSERRAGSAVTRPIHPAGPSVVSLVILSIVAGGSTACGSDVARAAAAMTGGDPERGRAAISAYGCATCHVVPGVREARGLVGPPLTNIASRVYLAGRVPNTPANMQLWIQRPHAIDDQTAMPETGVTDSDARDLAAYLYTLR
jgi:putative membrane protein